MKRQSTIAAVLAVATLLLLLATSGCGSRHRSAPVGQPPASGVYAEDGQTLEGLWLASLKDVTGAPIGVRVTWTRSNDVTVQGYYIYRDTQSLSQRDPTKRVNQGAMIPQAPAGQSAMSFDDYFKAGVGTTYYYRITAVDFDGDESAFSVQRTITIGRFNMTGFTPQQGPVDCEVRIEGEHFGMHNPGTDHVYFTGLVDDKTPSALQPGQVEAYIDPLKWTDRAIRVNVPPGTTTGPITLVVGGLSQVSLDDFVCISPYITNVTPDPARSGDTLEIDGENLGSHQLENRLLLNGVPYQTITSWNNYHVRATVPSGIEPGLYEVQLRVKVLTRLEDTNSAWIDIIGLPPAPRIDKVSPLFGEPGYTEVTVSGSNFGTDASIAELRFNGLSLTESDFISYSDSTIELLLPDGVTRSGEVQLILHATEDVPGNLYRYTANIYEPGYAWADDVAAGFHLGRYSATAYDSAGMLHVLFTDNTPNVENPSLFIAHELSGGDFAFETIDTAMYAEFLYVAMAIDALDHIHIAYQVKPYGYYDYKEVRYGYYDGSSWSVETVYSDTGEYAGDYLDIAVFYDTEAGGVDRYIAWRNATTGNVQVASRLYGSPSWEVTDAFYGEPGYWDIGYHLAMDLLAYDSGVFAPPKQPSALVFEELGFSWASVDEKGDWWVEWGWVDPEYGEGATEMVDGPFAEVKETDTEYLSGDMTSSVMWVTDTTVYWAYYDYRYNRFTTETVLSDSAPIGAGSRMKLNSSEEPQIFGHRSGNQF